MASSVVYLSFLEGSSLLTPDYSLFVTFFIFLALVFVLNRLMLRPIMGVIEERERLTSGAMHEAKKMGHDYDQRLSKYEEQIRAARSESYQMLENKRKDALTERDKLIAQVKSEVGQSIEASRLEIEKSSNEAKNQLEAEARAMANTIASNLLKRSLGGNPR
ncbi:MAG: ATP synthase F0 subunit B [Blastocatellia bacterium]|nr:ATP synthase F0 subunit B [Blastocatellia bacterium]